MAITSAFQADDAGSIPAARSSKTNEVQVFQHWRFFSRGKRSRISLIALPNYNGDQLWFRCCVFWCYRNSALLVGFFFDISMQGLIMHYPDVVNITKWGGLHVRGWFKWLFSGETTVSDGMSGISGGTRHLTYIIIILFSTYWFDHRLNRRFFFGKWQSCTLNKHCIVKNITNSEDAVLAYC